VPLRGGVHLPWADLPAHLHRWAAEIGGGPPEDVVDLAGGFSPGATARVRFEVGPELFIKAVGTDLNPESPGLHRREARVAALLPPSAAWPRLLQVYDDDDWVALAFELVDGRPPRHPWQRDELHAVLGALERLHWDLTPAPAGGIEQAAVHHAATFDGWRTLAGLAVVPDGLDRWSRRHLARLADLESGWAESCAGDTLLHCDIRSDNILLGVHGPVFVDWPHAAVGRPVLDLVCWAPSVVLEGGPDPEELLAGHGPSRDAEPGVVTTLAAAVAGFFVERSLLPAPPGLPTLRAFQAAQGEVALAWLQRRTGW
jgi:hypothetical protein